MADTADQGPHHPGDDDLEFRELAEVRVELARLAGPSALPEGRRIELRARILATRARLDWRDLVQEARTRLWTGRRRWHREETFTACFDRTMKSLVRDYWRGQQVPIVAVNDVAAGLRDAPDLEREALARDEVADISKALDHGKQTLEIAMARARGDTPAEIKSRFRLTETELLRRRSAFSARC